MKRFSAILLLVAVAVLGSGAVRHVHDLVHTHSHAEVGVGHHHHHDEGESHGTGSEHPATPVPHDESNCLLYALLKLPMLGAGVVPMLVLVGLFVAFLTQLPTPAVQSRRPTLLLDSRGPPARLSIQPV